MKKILMMLGAVVVLMAMLGDNDIIPDAQAGRDVSEEDRVAGFHCLNTYDGSHHWFTSAIKERLRDPNSFEHISTKVTPVSENGTHTIRMKYRARNGFGGMTVGLAGGRYEHDQCSDVSVSFID